MNYALFESLCKENHTTPTALTIKLGLSKGNSSSWKKGGNPSADILIKLADELNCTVDELLGRDKTNSKLATSDEKELLDYYKELDERGKGSVLGKAEGLAEAARQKKKVAHAATPKTVRKVTPAPVLDEEEPEEEYIYLDFPTLPASAGTGVYLHSDDTEPLKVPSTPETRKANYALRVAGDSMQPRFYDGDVVLVRTQPTVEPGEIGIFIYNGEGYIKQFGGNRLISINPDYDDIYITDPDNFYCKGRVIGVLSIKRDS